MRALQMTEKYLIKNYALFDRHFKAPLVENFDFKNKKQITTSQRGIYFLAFQIAQKKYAIYIGSTQNLKDRFDWYLGNFQPHAASDFKLMAFYQYTVTQKITGIFSLHFKECQALSKNELQKKEQSFISAFSPLINGRINFKEDNRKLEVAYIDYFENIFYKKINNQNG